MADFKIGDTAEIHNGIIGTIVGIEKTRHDCKDGDLVTSCSYEDTLLIQYRESIWRRKARDFTRVYDGHWKLIDADSGQEDMADTEGCVFTTSSVLAMLIVAAFLILWIAAGIKIFFG